MLLTAPQTFLLGLRRSNCSSSLELVYLGYRQSFYIFYRPSLADFCYSYFAPSTRRFSSSTIPGKRRRPNIIGECGKENEQGLDRKKTRELEESGNYQPESYCVQHFFSLELSQNIPWTIHKIYFSSLTLPIILEGPIHAILLPPPCSKRKMNSPETGENAKGVDGGKNKPRSDGGVLNKRARMNNLISFYSHFLAKYNYIHTIPISELHNSATLVGMGDGTNPPPEKIIKTFLTLFPHQICYLSWHWHEKWKFQPLFYPQFIPIMKSLRSLESYKVLPMQNNFLYQRSYLSGHWG